MKHSDEGMGLSVIVYAIAMMCGLGVCVLPILWANGARVYDNPGVSAANLSGGPQRMDHPAAYPLAVLQHEQIVSPAMLAELNAKVKKEKPAPTRRASVSRPPQDRYAQAQDDQTGQRPARRPFFFSFF